MAKSWSLKFEHQRRTPLQQHRGSLDVTKPSSTDEHQIVAHRVFTLSSFYISPLCIERFLFSAGQWVHDFLALDITWTFKTTHCDTYLALVEIRRSTTLFTFIYTARHVRKGWWGETVDEAASRSCSIRGNPASVVS